MYEEVGLDAVSADEAKVLAAIWVKDFTGNVMQNYDYSPPPEEVEPSHSIAPRRDGRPDTYVTGSDVGIAKERSIPRPLQHNTTGVWKTASTGWLHGEDAAKQAAETGCLHGPAKRVDPTGVREVRCFDFNGGNAQDLDVDRYRRSGIKDRKGNPECRSSFPTPSRRTSCDTDLTPTKDDLLDIWGLSEASIVDQGYNPNHIFKWETGKDFDAKGEPHFRPHNEEKEETAPTLNAPSSRNHCHKRDSAEDKGALSKIMVTSGGTKVGNEIAKRSLLDPLAAAFTPESSVSINSEGATSRSHEAAGRGLDWHNSRLMQKGSCPDRWSYSSPSVTKDEFVGKQAKSCRVCLATYSLDSNWCYECGSALIGYYGISPGQLDYGGSMENRNPNIQMPLRDQGVNSEVYLNHECGTCPDFSGDFPCDFDRTEHRIVGHLHEYEDRRMASRARAHFSGLSSLDIAYKSSSQERESTENCGKAAFSFDDGTAIHEYHKEINTPLRRCFSGLDFRENCSWVSGDNNVGQVPLKVDCSRKGDFTAVNSRNAHMVGQQFFLSPYHDESMMLFDYQDADNMKEEKSNDKVVKKSELLQVDGNLAESGNITSFIQAGIERQVKLWYGVSPRQYDVQYGNKDQKRELRRSKAGHAADELSLYGQSTLDLKRIYNKRKVFHSTVNPPQLPRNKVFQTSYKLDRKNATRKCPAEDVFIMKDKELKTEAVQVNIPKLNLDDLESYDEMLTLIRTSREEALPFLCLPEEVILYIFSFLTIHELTKCVGVCKQFYRIASDESLWKEISLKKRNDISDETLLKIARKEPISLSITQSHGRHVTREGLRKFFQLCGENLEELDFSACSGGAFVGEGLLLHISTRCTKLRSLDISWCNVGDVGIESIADVSPRLESLCINGCQAVTDAAINHVVKKHGESLRILEVFGCFNITQTALLFLAQHCPNLETLNIGQCHKITDISMSHLAMKLQNLENLDLRGCIKIRDSAVKDISRHCLTLSTLVLANCPLVTDASLVAIGSNSRLLRRLDLCGCGKLTDKGVQALAKSCHKLEVLDLSSTSITPKSVFSLANYCSHSLQSLKISFCYNVTEPSILCLVKKCKRLTLLHLYGCKKLRNLEKLREGNPKLKVEGESQPRRE